MPTDIKLSKAQIKKLIRSGGCLAKNVSASLGLKAAMSAIDGSIQKKIHGSGVKLIIEQEDMNE